MNGRWNLAKWSKWCKPVRQTHLISGGSFFHKIAWLLFSPLGESQSLPFPHGSSFIKATFKATDHHGHGRIITSPMTIQGKLSGQSRTRKVFRLQGLGRDRGPLPIVTCKKHRYAGEVPPHSPGGFTALWKCIHPALFPYCIDFECIGLKFRFGVPDVRRHPTVGCQRGKQLCGL